MAAFGPCQSIISYSIFRFDGAGKNLGGGLIPSGADDLIKHGRFPLTAEESADIQPS